MYEGRFRWSVPDHAEKRDFDTLDKGIKDALSRDEEFDPRKHSVYQIVVMPIIFVPAMASWKDKKRDYSRLDSVLVHTEAPTSDVRFSGIWPVTTRVVAGKQQPDLPSLEGEIVLKFGGWGRMKLKASKLGRALRQKGYSVFSTWRRDEAFAQWVFFRHWIENNPDFRMKVMCYVPNDLGDMHRYVKFSITGQANGAALESESRRVRLQA